MAELRDQAQCQGYRLVDADAPLPPWVDKKCETDGTSNEVLQGKVAILSHEVAELRDQAQCQGYRLVDADAPLPPWVDKKCETDGTSNEVLGAVDRLTKIERDVAELTKVMEQYVKDQNASVADASQERTELDCEEMLNKTQSGTPLTEEIRESAVISVSVMDRSSSRKSLVKVMSSMTTITTVFYFDESVWSAAAWVGHLSFVESATVSVVLIVNVCVQLYFTILVVLNLGDYSDISLADNDLKGFLAWRVTSAHHVKNYDEITNTSLATRVCDHWPGIIASYDQMQHVKAFDSYTGDGSQFDLALGGPGLALLCVMCWICLVAKDVLDNLDFRHRITLQFWRGQRGAQVRRLVPMHVRLVQPLVSGVPSRVCRPSSANHRVHALRCGRQVPPLYREPCGAHPERDRLGLHFGAGRDVRRVLASTDTLSLARHRGVAHETPWEQKYPLAAPLTRCCPFCRVAVSCVRSL